MAADSPQRSEDYERTAGLASKKKPHLKGMADVLNYFAGFFELLSIVDELQLIDELLDSAVHNAV